MDTDGFWERCRCRKCNCRRFKCYVQGTGQQVKVCLLRNIFILVARADGWDWGITTSRIRPATTSPARNSSSALYRPFRSPLCIAIASVRQAWMSRNKTYVGGRSETSRRCVEKDPIRSLATMLSAVKLICFTPMFYVAPTPMQIPMLCSCSCRCRCCRMLFLPPK